MRFCKVLKIAAFFVFGYLWLLSLTYYRDLYPAIVIILIGIMIWFRSKIICALGNRYRANQILVGILLLGGAIRLLWAIFVPSLPVSDFLYFQQAAIHLSQNTASLIKNTGYPLLLSIGFRIYPGVLTGKIINSIASTLSILFVYLIGAKLIDRKTGLIAAFLIALFPSEVIMVSVLSTEVALTTMILAAAFFLFHATWNRSYPQITSIFCAGLFYGLGFTIRSSSIFYLPAILLWVIFTTTFHWKQTGKVFGFLFAGIAAGLSLVVMSYSILAGQFSLAPLRTQDSLPFLSGTNLGTSGTWSPADESLYLSWPVEKRDALARQEAFNRIMADPIAFLSIIPDKIATLFGANDYGILWSVESIDWGEGNHFGIHTAGGDRWEKYGHLHDYFIKINRLFLQSTYVVIWFFALCSIRNFRDSPLPIIGLTLVLSTLLPHTILEVQGRYHHYIMPFIILLAAYGITRNVMTDRPIVKLWRDDGAVTGSL